MNTKGRDKGPCLFVAAKHVAEKQGLNDFRLCVRVGSRPLGLRTYTHSITFVRYFSKKHKGKLFFNAIYATCRRDNSKESQIFLSPCFCLCVCRRRRLMPLQRESSVLCRSLASFFAEWIGASANGKAELAMVIEVYACALAAESKLHSAHAECVCVCGSLTCSSVSVCLRLRRQSFEQCGCKLNAAVTRQKTYSARECFRSFKISCTANYWRVIE